MTATGRRVEAERRLPASVARAQLASALASGWSAGETWIGCRGFSMFPTSPPGARLRIVPPQGALSTGQVVVFERRGALVAHRLVARERDEWIAKGDGAVACDPPVAEASVLGVADAVRFLGLTRRLTADAGRAALSLRLGRACERRAHVLSAPIARLLYLALFTLALARLAPRRLAAGS